MPTRKQKQSFDEIVETCTFLGTFIELRRGDRLLRYPPGEERLAYHIYCLCGLIDGDGMACLLGQPEAEKRAMFRSARKLGLHRFVEHVKKAAAALKKSGLRLGRSEHKALSALMRPFEKIYYSQLRKTAYTRLYKLLMNSDSFLPYGLNAARMEKEGANPFDPKEWSSKKIDPLLKSAKSKGWKPR